MREGRIHHLPGHPGLASTCALGAALALAVFACGLAVYGLDRPAGSAAWWPDAWAARGAQHGVPPVAFFGALGGNLPSFAHAFAFSLLSALVLPWRLRWAASACVFWAGVDAVFEALQWPALAQPVAAALHSVDPPWPQFDLLADYLLRGRFDPLDLLASSLGAAMAFGLATLVIRRRARIADLRIHHPESST